MTSARKDVPPMVRRLKATGDFTPEDFADCTPRDLFRMWLEYEGIIGYSGKILNALKDCGFQMENMAKVDEGEVYTANDTMKLIGHSYAYKLGITGGKYAKAVDEVAEARNMEAMKWEALDFFMLGVLCGIREERQRRRTGRRSWMEERRERG